MWIVAPPSYPSAPVSVDLTSPSNESFQHLASSVLWRSKPSRPQSWRTRWQRVHWMRHLSGLTCEPSTLERGVAAWISSLRASRANRSQSPASAGATPTRATSGRTSAGLSTGRDRVSSFSKTSQASLLLDAPEAERPMNSSDPSYSDWLTELRQSSLRRRKLAHRTNENGCSSSAWPTPQASDDQRDRQSDEGVIKWSQREKASSELAVSARLWTTPSSRDWKDTEGMATEGTNPDGTDRDRLDQLPRQVFQFGRQAPPTPQDGTLSSPSGPTSPRRLNPAFVGWLMGYPLGWTSFEPTETPSCQPKAPTPCGCCCNYTGGGKA